jgi:hypothetical protein
VISWVSRAMGLAQQIDRYRQLLDQVTRQFG